MEGRPGVQHHPVVRYVPAGSRRRTQSRFGVIEVELDTTQNIVIDDILVAQLNDRPALNIERRLLQTLVGGSDQTISAIFASARANLQLPDAVIVFNAEPLHDFQRKKI